MSEKQVMAARHPGKGSLPEKGAVKSISAGKGLLPVLLIAAAVFAVRFVCALFLRTGPNVLIDENLYTSIAKSFSTDLSVFYRGHPVDYPYLLYPAVLSPVYILNRLIGGDIYRWVQAFNCLMMACSVIPAYMFSREFSGDRRKALTVSALYALMPDGFYSGFLMTESLLWLLSACLILCAFRAFRAVVRQEKAAGRYAVLTAVLTFLMFITKPGAIAMGCVLLLMLAVLRLRKKQKILPSVLPLLLLAAMIIAWYALYYLLLDSARGGVLGLYDKQLSEFKPYDLLVMAIACVVMPLTGVFALCGVFVIFPVLRRREYSDEQKAFIPPFVLGILAACIGTAIFVVPYKREGDLSNLEMHLRYISMYLPAFFTFTLSLPERAAKLKSRDGKKAPKGGSGNRAAMIVLGVFALLCLFPGARYAFRRGCSMVDSLTLSGFFTSSWYNGASIGWILAAATAAFILFLIFCLSEHLPDRNCNRLCVGFMVFFLLFNNVAAGFNTYMDLSRTLKTGALEINDWMADADEDVIGVTPLHYNDVYGVMLDARQNRPMTEVTSEQLCVELIHSGGVYVPFVPVSQSPNMNEGYTPDTHTFVLGYTVLEHMELNPSVQKRITSDGAFAMITIKDGERMADSVFLRCDRNNLAPYEKKEELTSDAGIFVTDPARAECPALTVTVWASGTGRMEIDGQVFTLTDSSQPYSITIPGKKYIHVRALDGNISVFTYKTEIAE